MATSPAAEPDGRLAEPVALGQRRHRGRRSPAMHRGDERRRFAAAAGDAGHVLLAGLAICIGCPALYEVGPVRR